MIRTRGRSSRNLLESKLNTPRMAQLLVRGQRLCETTSPEWASKLKIWSATRLRTWNGSISSFTEDVKWFTKINKTITKRRSNRNASFLDSIKRRIVIKEGSIFLNENLVTRYLPCVHVHHVHVSPLFFPWISRNPSPEFYLPIYSPPLLSSFNHFTSDALRGTSTSFERLWNNLFTFL